MSKHHCAARGRSWLPPRPPRAVDFGTKLTCRHLQTTCWNQLLVCQVVCLLSHNNGISKINNIGTFGIHFLFFLVKQHWWYSFNAEEICSVKGCSFICVKRKLQKDLSVEGISNATKGITPRSSIFCKEYIVL